VAVKRAGVPSRPLAHLPSLSPQARSIAAYREAAQMAAGKGGGVAGAAGYVLRVRVRPTVNALSGHIYTALGSSHDYAAHRFECSSGERPGSSQSGRRSPGSDGGGSVDWEQRARLTVAALAGAVLSRTNGEAPASPRTMAVVPDAGRMHSIRSLCRLPPELVAAADATPQPAAAAAAAASAASGAPLQPAARRSSVQGGRRASLLGSGPGSGDAAADAELASLVASLRPDDDATTGADAVGHQTTPFPPELPNYCTSAGGFTDWFYSDGPIFRPALLRPSEGAMSAAMMRARCKELLPRVLQPGELDREWREGRG
jgi:hypothetical protein